jgi:hypothetical protein
MCVNIAAYFAGWTGFKIKNLSIIVWFRQLRSQRLPRDVRSRGTFLIEDNMSSRINT